MNVVLRSLNLPSGELIAKNGVFGEVITKVMGIFRTLFDRDGQFAGRIEVAKEHLAKRDRTVCAGVPGIDQGLHIINPRGHIDTCSK